MQGCSALCVGSSHKNSSLSTRCGGLRGRWGNKLEACEAHPICTFCSWVSLRSGGRAQPGRGPQALERLRIWPGFLGEEPGGRNQEALEADYTSKLCSPHCKGSGLKSPQLSARPTSQPSLARDRKCTGRGIVTNTSLSLLHIHPHLLQGPHTAHPKRMSVH